MNAKYAFQIINIYSLMCVYVCVSNRVNDISLSNFLFIIMYTTTQKIQTAS